MKDCREEWFDAEKKVSVTIVDVTSAAQALVRGHLCGPTSAHFLTEALASAALLGVEMSEADETLILQMKCSGPLGGYNVECTAAGTLRGYTEKKVLDEFDGLGKPDARKVIGRQQIQVTRSLPGKILSQGISTSVDGYLAGSLQRKACLRVEASVSDDVEILTARGILVEDMPDAKGDLVCCHASEPKSLCVASRNLLKQLGLERAELKKSTPLSFACRCSPERAEAMLAALSDDERKNLPPTLDITCHMCGRTFSCKPHPVETPVASRRSFLALGAGALFAQALGGLKVFETGIVDEQVLKVEQLEIPVGLPKPFKVMHISDTHLNFFDAVDFSSVERRLKDRFNKRWVRFPQAVQSFYASLDYAAKRKLPILHTGDLIDFVTDGNERFLEHNLSGVNLHYAIGNHEYQMGSPENYDPNPEKPRSRLQRFFADNLSVSSRIMGGINFVAFDNARMNLRDEVIRGVKAEFEKPYPVVLMCHIPPFYTAKFLDNSLIAARSIMRGQGAAESEVMARKRPGNIWNSYDRQTREFYTWVQTKSQLKAILCGHTHIAEVDGFSETAQMYVAGGNYEGRAYEITFV